MGKLIKKSEFPFYSSSLFLLVSLGSIYLTLISAKAISISEYYSIQLRHGFVVLIPAVICFFLCSYMKKNGIKTALKMFCFFCFTETVILIYYLYQFFDRAAISHGDNIIETFKYSIGGVLNLIKFNMYYFLCIAPVLIIGIYVIFLVIDSLFGSSSSSSKNKKRVTGDDRNN